MVRLKSLLETLQRFGIIDAHEETEVPKTTLE
jgi:hypothetical protein